MPQQPDYGGVKPVVPGNIQWYGRQRVPTDSIKQGSYGTVYSESREENSLEVLYPRIYDGKLHSSDEAWQHYKTTGQHMGKFRTAAEADKFGEMYHEQAAAGKYDMPNKQTRYVQLPNGSYLEWPEGVSADEFKAKALKVMGQPASNVRPDTAVDKMFPAGATVSAPHSRTGLAGIEDELSNLRTQLSMRAQKGVGQGAGDFMMSLPLGLLRAAKSAPDILQGKPWQATKDLVGGGLEAGTIPLSFIAPESAGKAKASVALEDAAKVITDAVNPLPKQMGAYQKALAQHLDKILTYAASKGINLDSIEGIGSAMKGAGDWIRSHYYENILGPVKEVPMDISGIKGYSGETASPSTASLSQLDARLSQINAELNPKFAKGGIAAQAAVKSAGDLNAEASSIRSVLYKRLGEATGLDPQVVAQTRGAFGSLDNLAEQTNAAASKGRFAANKAATEPVTVNPFGGSKGKQFILDKAVNAARGNPTTKAIRNAASKADVPRYRLPEPNPSALRSTLKPGGSPKPRSWWNIPKGGGGGAPPTEPSAAERAAVSGRVAARAAGNKAAQEAKTAKMAARNPPRAGSTPIGEVSEPSGVERGAVAQKLDQRRLANELAKRRADLATAQAELEKLTRSTRHPFWQGGPQE